MKIVGKIIKYFIIAIILGVNVMLIMRVFMYTDNSTLDELVVDSAVIDAYKASPDTFEVKTHDIADIIAEDGSFFAYGLYYIPSAQRLQVTIKYNVSTVEAAFGTTNIEVGHEFNFTFTDGTVNLMPSSAEYGEKNIYRYARLTFDGVEMETAEKYTLYMYAVAAGNYPPDAAYAELPCHYIDQPWEPFKLSGSVMKQLESNS